MDSSEQRTRMVELQLVARGIEDSRVLEAFRSVPREAFLPDTLAEFAYYDSPLPLGDDQTISQPYLVAVTTEALRLSGGERVLDVGTGSGHAAAILGHIAKEVYSVERLQSLADMAREHLRRAGYDNVYLRCGDGTLGWQEHAPYDAIAVAAGGPKVPRSLLAQLAIGGRLVMPVGTETAQQLVRVTREGEDEYRREILTGVRFVPLIGDRGWPEPEPEPESEPESGAEEMGSELGSPQAAFHANPEPVIRAPRARRSEHATVSLIREAAEPIHDLESASVEALLDRIGDARVVLLGESTHGTSEFHRMRARITKELIERHGFDFVAVEADWPDAARVDDYVLGDAPRSKVEMDSTCTACSPRLRQCSLISMTSIRMLPGWHEHATVR